MFIPIETYLEFAHSLFDTINEAEVLSKPPEIENVIFNDPATIVFWKDGTKTIVKCRKDKGDVFSKETGLAMAIVKKLYGNKGKYNDILKKWVNPQ